MSKAKGIFLLVIISNLIACTPAQENHFPLVEATIDQIQSAIINGDVTCREVVTSYFERIETYDSSMGINAITVVNPTALDRAEEIDNALQNDEELPELFCTPLLVKDNFDTYDMVTSGGSIALKDNIPPNDAFMIRKLREAGAIVIAKTNMAEWAFSPRQTVSSSFGRTANAYDVNYVPAGSSGGTASGVAASFGVAGLGSDTGNSIRGPSSHLALFGIRSTLGLTSRDGVIPLFFDRDVGGPMTRTVEDGVRLFNVIAGYDPTDSLSVPDKRETDYRNFLRIDGLAGKRIGVLRTLVDPNEADAEIVELFNRAIIDLRNGGAVIIDPFEIAEFEKLTEENLMCPRFRYDMGQYLKTLVDPPINDVNEVLTTGQYGESAKNVLEDLAAYPFDIAPENWAEPCPSWPNHPGRNELLANILASMDALQIDAIIYPSWSNPPARIDQAVEQYKGDNSQVFVPAAGLPAVTVPMGFLQDKLQVGLQIVGRPFAEGMLIELAYGYEQRTHHRKPPSGFPELK